MSEPASPSPEVAEAYRLLDEQKFEQALEIYEHILRTRPSDIVRGLSAIKNLNAHKELLKCRLVFQILAQKNSERGFSLNVGDFCFLNAPPRDVFVPESAIQALVRYKGPCGSIQELKTGVLQRVATHPCATAIIYCTHAVAIDIVDLCLVAGSFPMARVADFGAGAGLQSVALARLNRQVAHVSLFEVQDFMQAAIIDVFKANGIDSFQLNEPISQPTDFFYSFRACGFLFSIDTYYDQIRAHRSTRASALFDIGDALNLEYETGRLSTLFKNKTPMYQLGRPPHRQIRTLFDTPI